MSSVTVRPSARAAAFTGLGDGALPRPRRRSARVTTRTTSWPAATSARSGGTAISGVPRYARRTVGPGGRSAQAEAAAGRRLVGRLLDALVLGERLLALL